MTLPLHAFAQGFSPTDAVKRMKTADDVRVRLVASEPLVRQPVAINFDDRGRLWVMQYLQYPTPAGLKAVKVDRYLRTVYDKLPDPPPKGPKGADRLTILEDSDGDGVMDRAKDFLSGLNLATGFAHGYGGVFVVQAPYLLFYPDRNRDDVPDGDPEVLLTGFGMEDAHAFANSLTWGPDGWLYGAQGSTVTANIRGIRFQQGIWRYHPVSKKFELFAEGGGNTWGLDFDREGNVIAGTNYGGAAMLHQVQGGYYVKGFEKHGPLQNPFTFGYFEHCPYEGFVGGHVTCGGVVYQGGALPEKYNNQYIAANLLSNAVHWHKIERWGSTFKNKRGGELLVANDTWFRPIDCEVGPDGAVYVADWTDKRANHVDPHDDWDRTNGRIYAIEPLQPKPLPKFDLQTQSNDDLAKLWNHPNAWFRRKALRILGERQAKDTAPFFEKAMAEAKTDRHWALWFLDAATESSGQGFVDAMRSNDPLLQMWAVRFSVDGGGLPRAFVDELLELSGAENVDIRVRQQLACSLRRIPLETQPDLALLQLYSFRELLKHDSDANDPYQPMSLWWALEQAASKNENATAMIANKELWSRPLAQRFLIERLARRFASGDERLQQGAVKLYDEVNENPGRDKVLAGIEAAFDESPPAAVPKPLEPIVADLWKDSATDQKTVRLLAKMGHAVARTALCNAVDNRRLQSPDRKAAIKTLGQIAFPKALPDLLPLLADDAATEFHLDLVAALRRFNDERIPPALIARMLKSSGNLRTRCLEALAAKPPGARALLGAVDEGKLKPTDVPNDTLANILLFNDKPLAELIEKHWGKIKPMSLGEKTARVHGIKVSLHLAKGDLANGKKLFTKHCGNCHQLFGEGAKIGPDLTGAERGNRDFLLTSIVDPSAVIRREYTAQTVVTTDGQVLSGLVAEATPSQIVLIDSKAQKVPLRRSEIEEMKPSATSIMPEKLLDALSAQEVRDLVAYLQSQPSKK